MAVSSFAAHELVRSTGFSRIVAGEAGRLEWFVVLASAGLSLVKPAAWSGS